MAITRDLVGDNSYPGGPLLAGPLVGETSETEARIWVQARDSSPLGLTLYQPDGTGTTFTANPVQSEAYCVTFVVTGLASRTTYQYDLQSGNGTTDRYAFTSGMPADSRRAKVAFGSCFCYADAPAPIFSAIRNEQPDAFVMAGDNAYYPSTQTIYEEDKMLLQLKHRNHGELRPLVASVQTLGIWDDHDFGRNDEDSATTADPGGAASTFKRMWAQSQYGLASTPGIFSVVRCGPADLFLTDGRSYRVDDKQILGFDQLAWLKSCLSASSAPVKIIVSGSVVLPQFVETIENRSWEGYRRDAPTELSELLAYIEYNDIRGVVFLSGDLHISYVMHRAATPLGNGNRGPEYWEIISSPLSNDIWRVRVKHGPNSETYDPALVEEVLSLTYGTLDIDLDRAGAELSLALKDPSGSTLVERSVSLSDLAVRVAPPPKLSVAVWPNGTAYFFRGASYAAYNPDPKHEGVMDGYPRPIAGNWPGLAEKLGGAPVDAVFVMPDQTKAHFFHGNGYTRYTIGAGESADRGYPAYVSRWWRGLWHEGVDAAVLWPNGKAFFFRGTEYLAYELASDTVESGYPRPIAGNWPGLAEAFPDGIDAAVVWPNGKAYFFRGDQYVAYRIEAPEGVMDGYPKPIAGNWVGLDRL